MARKKKHEEHENHERWLVSYADFITLLFAFFVVMYSVSSVNEGKYRVLSDALLAAFRSPQKTLTPIQFGQSAKGPQTENLAFKQTPNLISAPDLPLPDLARGGKGQGRGGDPLAEIADEVEAALSRLIDEDLIAVRFEDDYVEIEIKSSILFPAGSTALTKDATKVLTELAKILRNFPNFIRVEGHTDDTPIQSKVYASNWVLSAARAASVVHLFERKGIHPGRMGAVGYAKYRPVGDNETLEGRNQNRRVSVIVVNQTDTAQMREDLYLASESKDGKVPVRGFGDDANEWMPPSDVTNRPVTDSGDFTVIEDLVDIPKPFLLNVAPPIERVDRIRSTGLAEQPGGQP